MSSNDLLTVFGKSLIPTRKYSFVTKAQIMKNEINNNTMKRLIPKNDRQHGSHALSTLYFLLLFLRFDDKPDPELYGSP